MFEDEVRPAPEDVEPGVVLPVLGEGEGDGQRAEANLDGSFAHSGGGGRPPGGLRARTKALGAAAIALAVAIGVVVPLELGSALSVSGAVGSVFAAPVARFVVTETGTRQLHGYALAVTIWNPAGGSVSAAGARDSYEISVLHDGSDLGDVMITHTAIYLRLNTTSIDQLIAADGGGLSLTRRLERIAHKHADLAWLQQVAAGDWIGFRLDQLKPYIDRLAKKTGTSASSLEHQSSAVRSAFTLSFAEAWDAWTSLHVASSSGGTTEYSVRLPVRKFLLSFARDFEAHIAKTLPQTRKVFPMVNRALGQIPAKFALPVDLWVSNGSLTKVAVSYHGITVDVAISHPSKLPSIPQGVTYLTVRQLKAFGLYTTSASGISASSVDAIATESNLQTALTGAMTYYTSQNQSFTGLTAPGPNSVRAVDTGLLWLPPGHPSKSPAEISSAVAAGGGEVLLVAESPSARECLGVLVARKVVGHPLLGVAKPGLYFFVLHHTPASACNAAAINSVKHLSENGFPIAVNTGGGSSLLPFGSFGSFGAPAKVSISTGSTGGVGFPVSGMTGSSSVSGTSGTSG